MGNNNILIFKNTALKYVNKLLYQPAKFCWKDKQLELGLDPLNDVRKQASLIHD